MFIKLDNHIFNGDYKAEHIKMYILLLINKNILTDDILTSIAMLNELYGYKDISKNISKIRDILAYLEDMELIKINKSLENIKKKDNIIITINELNCDEFTEIEKDDLKFLKQFNTNEFTLYFLIKRYYNKTENMCQIPFRLIEDKIGITNKTAKKILDKFCSINLMQKYTSNNFIINQYRNFNNKIDYVCNSGDYKLS